MRKTEDAWGRWDHGRENMRNKILGGRNRQDERKKKEKETYKQNGAISSQGVVGLIWAWAWALGLGITECMSERSAI